MNAQELLPCPFCGGASILFAGMDGYSVRCTNIDCGVGVDMPKDEAIGAWNRRAPLLAALPGKNYPIDADELGIRAYVADAISGALAFGKGGTNAPPAGHWLIPFWEMGRAEAATKTRVPEGWKLAPLGTSWSMRNEGRELLIDYGVGANKLDHLVDTIYRAMLGAAPEPPLAPAPPPSNAEADRRDAERYRFLRSVPVGEPWGVPRIAVPDSASAGEFVNDVDADREVDAAIAKATGGA